MNKNRCGKGVFIAACLVSFVAVPAFADSDKSAGQSTPTHKSASPGSAANDGGPGDDFSGLNFSDEQKAVIARIQQDAESKKAIIAKDDKLTSDQKDAMTLGYTRLEYGLMFRELTPIQQKVVRQRVVTRRSADQASQRKQQH